MIQLLIKLPVLRGAKSRAAFARKRLARVRQALMEIAAVYEEVDNYVASLCNDVDLNDIEEAIGSATESGSAE